MVEPGWYAIPGDPAHGRYWDGATWADADGVREGAFPSFPELEAAPPMAYVEAPGGEPTVAVPQTRPTYAEEAEVERRPADGRPTAIFAVATVVGVALLGLLLWLLLRNDGPEAPYPCGSGLTVTTWDDDSFTLNDGTRADWPSGTDPGSKDALRTVCRAAIAFQRSATTTTAPQDTATTTAEPSTTTAPPTTQAAPTTTTVALPAATPLGSPASLGNGLRVTVTGVDLDAAPEVTQADPSAPPPASGNRYVRVTVELANTRSQPVPSNDLALRLVSGSASYGPRDGISLPQQLDQSQPIPSSGTVRGDVIYEVPAAAAVSGVLRATTSQGDVLLQLS